jgi:hypothetical protein
MSIESMRKLPAYSKDKTCPKRGGSARSEHVADGEHRFGDETERWQSSYPPCELIIRACTNCGFAWDEAPLDA